MPRLFQSLLNNFFFWFQEPKTIKKEEIWKRTNKGIYNLSNAVQSSYNAYHAPQSLLITMSQSQLMQLFGEGPVSSLLGSLKDPSTSRTHSTQTSIVWIPVLVYWHQSTTSAGLNTPHNNTSVSTRDAQTKTKSKTYPQQVLEPLLASLYFTRR